VSGWGFPYSERGSLSMTVVVHYENGDIGSHPLKNGVEFADYNQLQDVPGSQRAFNLRGKQIRYLAVKGLLPTKISRIEFVKGPDDTAPIVMAVTIEGPD
jgi:uncharacterized protein